MIIPFISRGKRAEKFVSIKVFRKYFSSDKYVRESRIYSEVLTTPFSRIRPLEVKLTRWWANGNLWLNFVTFVTEKCLRCFPANLPLRRRRETKKSLFSCYLQQTFPLCTGKPQQAWCGMYFPIRTNLGLLLKFSYSIIKVHKMENANGLNMKVRFDIKTFIAVKVYSVITFLSTRLF